MRLPKGGEIAGDLLIVIEASRGHLRFKEDGNNVIF